MIRFIVKNGFSLVNTTESKEFIKELYKNTNIDKVIVYPEKMFLKVKIMDSNKNKILKTGIAFNIKHKDVLGHYCYKYDLSIYTNRRGNITIHNGTSTNNPIRKLFTI